MIVAKPSSSDEVLPPGRVVRWLVLAGVILLSVGLYFRYGLNTPPLGTAPAATSGRATPDTP